MPETPIAAEPAVPPSPMLPPEKPKAASPVAPERKPKASPSVSKTPGKGGPKHKYLQQFIKQWAQGMGHLAVIEEQVDDGQVDVSLQKNNRRIACEISITTDTGHETGNVKKCLGAGFDFVALVVPQAKRIEGLQKALRAALSDSEFPKVRVVTPDGLFEFVEELDAKDSSRNETVLGYKVKVTRQAVDQSTKEQRKAAISKVVAESLKRKAG